MGHMHHTGGAVLLVAAIIIAVVAGLASRGSAKAYPLATILAAILGTMFIYYLLRRL